MNACFAPLTLGLALGWAGCADLERDPAPSTEDFTGVEELASPLTALALPCDFALVSGVATATINISDGETAVISKRSVDSAILVNGFQCGTATATTLKRIAVSGSTGTDTVIFDFLNGSFAPGYGTGAGTPGITVDLVSGTADAVKIRSSAGADTLTAGADGLSFNIDNIKDITTANVDAFVFSLGAGADVFSGSGGYGTGLAFATVVTVYGGEGNDVISGGTGADVLSGGPGNDTLRGAVDAALDTAADVLNGEEGDDTFDAGNVSNGGDTFNGGAGTADHVSYALRTTALTITAGAGANDGAALETDAVAGDVEVITGGTGDDSIGGSAAPETINGGDGDDTLTGGDGNDILNGGSGDDRFLAGAATTDGADVYNGGTGLDVVSYAARSVGVTATLDGVANDGETGGGELDNVKADVEDLTGGAGNDILTGSASANVLTGGLGNDVLSGLAGNDTFDEGAVTSGADQFIGGLGTDTVDYSARAGILYVTMDGVAADDGLSLEGDDVEADVEDLLGGSGADFIVGNDSANSIDGGGGADQIWGGLGNDTLFGGAGIDILNGDAGDDILDGGADTEVILDCGAGDGDILISGAGETGIFCEL